MSGSQAEFNFRIWIHPEDGDSSDIEIWCHELEPMDRCKRPASEWVREYMENEDLHAAFELDRTKHFQVLGKGKIRGWFDYWGEYDEEMDIIEFETAEVPAEGES